MWSLCPIDFCDLPGWDIDDLDAAREAFARHSLKPNNTSYSVGALGIKSEWFDDLISQAQIKASSAKDFFENNFLGYKIENSENARGKVTGFYEPEVKAQRFPSFSYQVPIFERPSDLVAVSDHNRPSQMDISFRFGRKTENGDVVEYYDRAAIQSGALGDRARPLAYVDDTVDAFFIHIQGAARLVLDDSTTMRVTYDGKSGHPFTAIGKLLVDRGEIPSAEVSMQSIRSWLAQNPEKSKALMEENRSYIFFKEAEVFDEHPGPVAAAKIPLTPIRSLAVDRTIHTYATPIFVSADRVNGKPFDHLMIAQETGTAIIGPARGDIFFGSGDIAGEAAGAVNSPCDFYILVPKTAPFDPNQITLP